jgi:predicted permease
MDWLGDSRRVLRGLCASPSQAERSFAIAAIATIAIGIGAATAVFSAVDPLLFRPLPYPRADRLVSFGFLGPIDNNEFHIANTYLDWRDRETPFQAMTSMLPGTGCDLDEPVPRQVNCFRVEANFLRVLGVAPVLGRDFTAGEDRFNGPQVGLLSYALWKNLFSGDPGVLSRTLTLDERRIGIIGVLPAGFTMPQGADADILLLEQWNERVARSPNSTMLLRTFARLKDGVSIEQARQILQPLVQDSVKKYVPAALRTEVRLMVQSLRDRQIHEVKLASWMLLGAVVALLLLACANVANLLLARAAARRGEWAMRAALGATRARLIRQMLSESATLGILGGAVGVGLAFALLRTFIAIAPEGTIGLQQARIDTRVLLFALIASLASARARSRPRGIAGGLARDRVLECTFAQSAGCGTDRIVDGAPGGRVAIYAQLEPARNAGPRFPTAARRHRVVHTPARQIRRSANAGSVLSRSGTETEADSQCRSVRAFRFDSSARCGRPAVFEHADRRTRTSRGKRRHGGFPGKRTANALCALSRKLRRIIFALSA